MLNIALTILAGLGVAYWYKRQGAPTGPSFVGPLLPEAWTNDVAIPVEVTPTLTMRWPVAALRVSASGQAQLKRLEGLKLTRYRLGDGGWTIGYGRYYKDPAAPPESIDQATAEAWFQQDLEERAAKWVRYYVKVPLTQNEFDALASMAYNLSPNAFSTIAAAVNRGENPLAASMVYVRPGTKDEVGLRTRRAYEVALYHTPDSTV